LYRPVGELLDTEDIIRPVVCVWYHPPSCQCLVSSAQLSVFDIIRPVVSVSALTLLIR